MLIGAYAYFWYTKNWLHKTVRQNDPPLLGEYNNTVYGHCLNEQMNYCKQAGIDFLSISWNNEDIWPIIDSAKNAGIKTTCFYETLKYVQPNRASKETVNRMCDELKLILDYTEEDNWLRINNRPVVMIYVTRVFGDFAKEAAAKIRETLPEAYIIADEYFWKDVPDWKIELWDALTYYNMYRKDLACFDVKCENPEEEYLNLCRDRLKRHSDQCRRLGKAFWGCAKPGYNDTGVRPQKKHPPLSRKNGSFFARSLEDAKAISNEGIMICSLNEWYEDTQIEPAKSYGDLYLKKLRQFATEFKK